LFKLSTFSSSAPSLFLNKAIYYLSSTSSIHSITETEITEWKQSIRLSLHDILHSHSDSSALISWKLLLSTYYDAVSADGDEKGGNVVEESVVEDGDSSGKMIEVMFDEWRCFYHSLMESSISTTATTCYSLEECSIVLLYFICLNSFIPLSLLLEVSSEKKEQSPSQTAAVTALENVWEKVNEFLSLKILSETTSSRRIVIELCLQFINKFNHHLSSLREEQHNFFKVLLLSFLKKLFLQNQQEVISLVSSLFTLGTCLKSNYHARILFFISFLLTSSKLKFDKDMIQQFKSQLIEGDVFLQMKQCKNFEEKALFLYQTIFQPAFDQLTSLNMHSKKKIGDDGHPAAVSSFLEDRIQLLIQYHLKLSLHQQSPLISSDLALKNAFEEYPNQRKVVVASSPVRIDFAGGWSDTPPICYEQGGKVLNLAVQVNGKKPVKCVSRFIPNKESSKCCILMKCFARSSSSLEIQLVASEEVNDWFQLRSSEVHHSSSPCAIIKACLIALGIISELSNR
jgi:hypothetical protein